MRKPSDKPRTDVEKRADVAADLLRKKVRFNDAVNAAMTDVTFAEKSALRAKIAKELRSRHSRETEKVEELPPVNGLGQHLLFADSVGTRRYVVPAPPVREEPQIQLMPSQPRQRQRSWLDQHQDRTEWQY